MWKDADENPNKGKDAKDSSTAKPKAAPKKPVKEVEEEEDD